MFFVVKQKTAYEMRISDWSSDVCSSDLPALPVMTSVAAISSPGRGESISATGATSSATASAMTFISKLALNPANVAVTSISPGARALTVRPATATRLVGVAHQVARWVMSTVRPSSSVAWATNDRVRPTTRALDRTGVVAGKMEAVRVDIGG